MVDFLEFQEYFPELQGHNNVVHHCKKPFYLSTAQLLHFTRVSISGN